MADRRAHGERPVIGGGAKKVLYTLRTVSRIGVGKAAKALTAKNTCKACAYGMGGQNGGMVNELGEFPSVCNKSVQAQSTDIQPAIPLEIFEHGLKDLKELTGREIESLGRLNSPIHKAADSDRFTPVTWDWAIARAAAGFRATSPDRTFFYSSGRSSNEAAFLFQLMARAYGTNNVNNCSYYCHQATSEGLGTTIGKGTATVELADLEGADLIFVIGANPASNHPRFIHMLKACRDRGGDVVVINPAREPGLMKFAVPKSPKSMIAGGTEIASDFLQPRIGEDVALLKGLAKAVLALGAEADDFIASHTAGYEAFKADLDALDFADIEARCGVSESELMRVAALYARSRNAVFAWGMGLTHHAHGVANVEAVANLALLRGMIGKRFAGLLPLRGHSNVQGVGTIGVKPVLAETVLAALENHYGVNLPRGGGMDTLACMRAAAAGSVDCALIMGGNLYEASPNTAWAGEALSRIGLKVFLTTTLNRGHVHGLDGGEALILPVTARDEEWQPTTQESMFNFVRLSDGGIGRLDNVRPETHILADLASAMMPDAPVDFAGFKQHARTRDAIARIVPGMEELADIDVARREFHIRNRLMHAPRFDLPEGRARFQVTPITRGNGAGRERDGVLTLATIRSEGQFNTIIYEEKDSYRRNAGRWSVLLNASDMQARGIADGSTVDVCSQSGRMVGVTALAFDLPPGSAMAYFPEANILTGQEADPRSKTPAFKSVRVWVEKPGNGALKEGARAQPAIG
ncbi:MAG TPA: FdhF/YdeP family oxidoreductase [Devosiaceae bacterium]